MLRKIKFYEKPWARIYGKEFGEESEIEFKNLEYFESGMPKVQKILIYPEKGDFEKIVITKYYK